MGDVLAWLRGPVAPGGAVDRHPIAVPAAVFSFFWTPYVALFLRRAIAFGDVGSPIPIQEPGYWALLAVQLAVCVVSHSLTLRTIVRLGASRWLVWGSVAFFALSPTWGLLTAADIRHPLFAAVFCVFVSSATFLLYGRPTVWSWVQLAGGALAVCLLRDDGRAAALPALSLIVLYLLARRRGCAGLPRLSPTWAERRESRWSDAWAAFLVLAAVGLLSWATLSAFGGPPLGEPGFGASDGGDASLAGLPWTSGNLAGTDDVAGVLPMSAVEAESVRPAPAVAAARLFALQQRAPVLDLAFSWAAYELLLGAYVAWAALLALGRGRRGRPAARDPRPLVLAVPLAVVAAGALLLPGCGTLRYVLPFLAAQPMLFAACRLSACGPRPR